jgi:ribosome-binding protein aMBF1 (putative translation factor)
MKTEKIKWHSSKEVFGRIEKTKAFKEAYDEEMLRLVLAKRIRDIRAEKKLTQAAVAKRANTTQSVIARLESGQHTPSVETLGRVAHALGKGLTIA